MEKKPLKLFHAKHGNINVTFNQKGNIHVQFDIEKPIAHADPLYIKKRATEMLNHVASYFGTFHGMARRTIALADMQDFLAEAERTIPDKAERQRTIDMAMEETPTWYQNDIAFILSGLEDLKKECKTQDEFEKKARAQLGDLLIDYVKNSN